MQGLVPLTPIICAWMYQLLLLRLTETLKLLDFQVLQCKQGFGYMLHLGSCISTIHSSATAPVMKMMMYTLVLMLCWFAGEVCGSKDTCTETQLNIGEVCGTSSTTGCNQLHNSMLCWFAGEVCGSEDTCTETQLNTGEVCGTSSKSGCSCAPDQLPGGSRCDLYGTASCRSMLDQPTCLWA